MKKIITTGALLCVFGLLMAQQPGTIDKSFANNGDYIVSITGSGAWANFLTYHDFEDDGNPDTPAWGLLIGGSISTNYTPNGIFLTEVTDVGGINEWTGKPATGLTYLQAGIYLPDGGILAGGVWESNPFAAKVVRFSELGVVDQSFGSSGSVVLDNLAGDDYVHALYYNDNDPDNPYIMAAGSSFDANGKQRPAWWMLDQHGLLNTNFGTNGKFLPVTNTNQAWFNDIIPFGNKVLGIGQIDFRAYLNLLDPNTMVNSSYGYPESSDANNLYEFFSAGQDDNYFYPTGYHYNIQTDESLPFAKVINRTAELTEDRDQGAILAAAIDNIETALNGKSTGIQAILPAPLGPGNLKTDATKPMLVVGSVIIGDQPETTFLAGYLSDGSLDESFGTRGVTIIDIDNSNWPVDVVVASDGSFYVAMNSRGTVHVMKFHPYFDLSGIDQPDQLSEKVEIFPNPADEQLNLNIVLEEAQTIKWEVVNSLGQEVYSRTQSFATAGKHQISLDITQWDAGIYFFKTNTLRGSLSGSFLVN